MSEGIGQIHAKLSELIISSQLGSDLRPLIRVLNKQGAVPPQSLVSLSKMSSSDLQDQLTVLLKHNLIKLVAPE